MRLVGITETPGVLLIDGLLLLLLLLLLFLCSPEPRFGVRDSSPVFHVKTYRNWLLQVSNLEIKERLETNIKPFNSMHLS